MVSLETELLHYDEDGNIPDVGSLYSRPQSQVWQPELKDDKGKPMPPLEKLKEMAAELQELLDATVVIARDPQVMQWRHMDIGLDPGSDPGPKQASALARSQ